MDELTVASNMATVESRFCEVLSDCCLQDFCLRVKKKKRETKLKKRIK